MTTPRGIDTPERERAAKIRDRLAAEIEEISGQRNLSAAGRQARLARVVVKAQDELTALRQGEAQRVADRREELTRDLFGATHPDDTRIISLRDAADRASRLTDSAEAARLMNTAELHGDTILLKALARECAQRANPLEPQWGTLFQQWAATQPGGSDTATELGVIADEQGRDMGHRLAREQAFSIGALPEELRGLGNLRAVAEQADPDDATSGQPSGNDPLRAWGLGSL